MFYIIHPGPFDRRRIRSNQNGVDGGFPLERDSIVSASDGSFFRFHALRYSVCHMRQFLPTTNVQAAQINRYSFETEFDEAVEKVVFTPWECKESMTWEESLSQNYTDGILILHKGKIIYEKYFRALKQNGVHAAMSVSKTFAGTLGSYW